MGKLIAAILGPALLAPLAIPVLLPPSGMSATGATAAVSLVRSGQFPLACASPVLTQSYGPATVAGEPNDFHQGWDIACPLGTLVVSVTAGVAHTVTDGDGGGYGNNVQVHTGDLWVRYAHLALVLVADGDHVLPGTALGLEGSTGFSTGPHLHFEVDGACANWPCSIDPAGLISMPVGETP